MNGYAVEGHVPAEDVHRLLKTRAKVNGRAVPGMPIGSPGMEQGPRRQANSVVVFDGNAVVSEFQKYEAKCLSYLAASILSTLMTPVFGNSVPVTFTF